MRCKEKFVKKPTTSKQEMANVDVIIFKYCRPPTGPGYCAPIQHHHLVMHVVQ